MLIVWNCLLSFRSKSLRLLRIETIGGWVCERPVCEHFALVHSSEILGEDILAVAFCDSARSGLREWIIAFDVKIETTLPYKTREWQELKYKYTNEVVECETCDLSGAQFPKALAKAKGGWQAQRNGDFFSSRSLMSYCCRDIIVYLYRGRGIARLKDYCLWPAWFVLGSPDSIWFIQSKILRSALPLYYGERISFLSISLWLSKCARL